MLHMLKYVPGVQRLHHETVAYYCVVLLVAIGMMIDILLSSRLVIEKRKELMAIAWHHQYGGAEVEKKETEQSRAPFCV